MRKKIVAGNWKMNNDLNQTILLIEKLKKIEINEVSVMIAPSSLFLKTAKEQTHDFKIEVVSQNVHQENKGAYTGEVSCDMLKSIGISTTLIGHSERRAYFNEDDQVLIETLNMQ